MRITIPATIEEAHASLDGLGALLTAKEWERAAIVYAFTEPDVGAKRAQTSVPTGSEVLSITGFAKLGITGLTQRRDIAAYRRRWESAMQDGAPEAKPGADFEMPSLPWKSLYDDTDRGQEAVEARAFKRILKDPERFAKVVEDSPGVADLVAERVATDRGLSHLTSDRIREVQAEREAALPHRDVPQPVDVPVEKVIKAIDSFFEETLTHNGTTLTYRQVIAAVAEAGDVPELRRWSIVPTPLAGVLHDSLRRLSIDAGHEADRVARALPAVKEVEA